MFWLPYDEYDLDSPLGRREVDHNAIGTDELRMRHEPYFESMDAHIRELNAGLAETGKPVLLVAPVGLPVSTILESSNLRQREELNELLQKIAWEAVTNHPLSGVSSAL